MVQDMLFSVWRGEVLPDWLDYNRHMTEHRYLQVFGESSDALYNHIGVDFERADDGAFFTIESHLRHFRECHVGTRLYSETELIGYDEKRLHLFHWLFEASGLLVATGEHLSIHIRNGTVCAANEMKLARIEELFARFEQRPLPERIGSVMRKPLLNTRWSGSAD